MKNPCGPAAPGRARLGMTLEPLLYRAECILERISGTRSGLILESQVTAAGPPELQGHPAHKKQRPPRTLQKDYA